MKKLFILLAALLMFTSCIFDTKKEISSISFSEKSIDLYAGESKNINITYQPSDASDFEFQYTLSCEGIVTITNTSKYGCVINAINPGSVILICSAGEITDYCEIKVYGSDKVIDPYIIVPFVTLDIEKGKRKTVIASLYGGTALDNNKFTWTASNSNVKLEQVNNNCVIEAVSSGSTRITVHNPKSDYDASFIVIIPDENENIFYLTTQSNVINLSKGQTYNLNISNVGGNSQDNQKLTYSLKDGNGNISVNSNGQGTLYITGIKSGKSLIEINHEKAKSSLLVTVLVLDSEIESYIVCDEDFLILSGKETRHILCNVIGQNTEDVNEKYTYSIEDESVIKVEQLKNHFYVSSIKDGKSKLIIENKYCKYKKEVQFIVENTNLVSIERYITCSDNIIKLERGSTSEKVSVKLIGGNESDKNNFVYTVSDSSVIDISPEYGTVKSRGVNIIEADKFETFFYINALDTGISKISISNPKSPYDYEVTVIVYPEGYISETSYSFTGESIVKAVIGNNTEITIGEKSGVYLSDVKWEVSDSSLADISFTGYKAVVRAKKKGIGEILVTSSYAKTYKAILICGSVEEINSINVIYTDKNFYTLDLEKPFYIEIKNLNDVEATYRASINDENVAELSVSGNILVVKGKKIGSTKLILTSDISNQNYVIDLEVINSSISVERPYYFLMDDFKGLLLGTEEVFSCELKGAVEKEKQNISWEVSDSDIFEIKGNGESCLIKALKPGQAVLTVNHNKAEHEKKVILYSTDSASELEDKVLIYVDKTNFVSKIGEKIVLEVKINKPEEKDGINWEISDLSMFVAETSGCYAYLDCIAEGNATIKASIKGVQVNFFITVKDEKDEDIKEIKLPSLIELITGETKKLSITSYLSSVEKTCGQWTSNSENLDVSGNGETVLIKGLKKGFYTLEYKNSMLGYSKTISVLCEDNAYDFSNKYVLFSVESNYKIKAGEKLNIWLKNGTYELSDLEKKASSWSTEGDGVSINYNGFYGELIFQYEGIYKVVVENPYCINDCEFTVTVYEDNACNYSLVANTISKIVKNKPETILLKIINNNDNSFYEDYSHLKIEFDDNSIEYNLVENRLRLIGEKKGTYKFRIKEELLGLKFEGYVIVFEDATAEENDESFFSQKDHYLIHKGQVDYIKLKGLEEYSELSYYIEDNEIVSVSRIEDGKYEIKAIQEGSTTIIFERKGYVANVYVSVTENAVSSNSVISESFIVFKKGGHLRTEVFGNDNVTVTIKDERLSCSREGNYYTFTSEELLDSEVEFNNGHDSSFARVYVCDDSDVRLFNINKRKKSLSIGETSRINIQTYGNYNLALLKFRDVYENQIFKYSYENGVLNIIGKNEGVGKLNITDSKYSIDIIIEVRETLNTSSEEIYDDFSLYDEKTVYYLEQGSFAALYPKVRGSGNFSHSEDYIWECSNPDLINLEANGYFAYANAVGTIGECTVTLRNKYCSNILTYTIKIGKTYENLGITAKYLLASESVLSLEYGSEERLIFIDMVNLEGKNAEDISIECENGNLIEYRSFVKNNTLYVGIKPILCGWGNLIFRHKDADCETKIQFIVQEATADSIVYLTTGNNHVNVKKGEVKAVTVSLKNYEEYDSENFQWKVENDNIVSVIGAGQEVQIFGNLEGETQISVTHPKSKNTLYINVSVTRTEKTVSYITTNNNVIETYVSGSMSSFMVNLIGESGKDSYFKYASSDSSILSVIGNNNECFYRGLKPGNAQIIVSNTYKNDIDPLVITVVVTEKKTDKEYITTEDKMLYLTPGGANKTISVDGYNINGLDSSKYEWTVISQNIAVNSGDEVIRIISNKDKCVIVPRYEGIAKVRCTYLPLNLNVNIYVYVTNYGQISFSKESITLEEDEGDFVEICCPTFADNMDDFISYHVDNPLICTVSGSSKICYVKGMKQGETKVQILNSYDESVGELIVKVEKTDEENYRKIVVNKSCLSLNPRSKTQNLRASLSGNGISESDNDDIVWSYDTSNTSVYVYPLRGKEVNLSLKEVNGSIIEGETLINLSFTKGGKTITKSIYVEVKEIDGYFTLNKYSLNLDINETQTLKASLLGATLKDYEDIIWNVEAKVMSSDGSVKNPVRLMANEGAECTLLGVQEGGCYVTAFYKGRVLQCDVYVNPSKYFTLSNGSLVLYPGQKYELKYNLQPKDYSIVWYSTDEYTGTKLINRVDYPERQIIEIEAIGEGSTTLTGFVSGIGSVTCSIRVVYDPRLSYVSVREKSKVMSDEEYPCTLKTDLNNNIDERFCFSCYPPEYYVGYEVSSKSGNEQFVDIMVSQDHSSLNENQNAGRGYINLKCWKEFFPGDLTIKLIQYQDCEMTKPTGQELTFYFDCSYPPDLNPFEVYFQRYDGTQSELGEYCSKYKDSKLYELNTEHGLFFSDAEKIFLILKQKHKGQAIEDLKVEVQQPKGCPLQVTLSDFNMEEDNYVSLISIGDENQDIGFNCSYDSFKNETFKPDFVDNNFYGRFGFYEVTTANKKLTEDIRNKDFRVDQREKSVAAGDMCYSNSHHIYNNEVVVDRNVYWTNSFWNDQGYKYKIIMFNTEVKGVGKTEPYQISIGENKYKKFCILVNSEEDIKNFKKLFYTFGEVEQNIVEAFSCYKESIWGADHYKYYLNNKKEKVLNKKGKFVILKEKEFRSKYKFDLTNQTIDLWKDKEWMASGNGMNYPNLPNKLGIFDDGNMNIICKINKSDRTTSFNYSVVLTDGYRNCDGIDASGKKNGIHVNDITNPEFSQLNVVKN